jgi:hypothetical protein
MLGYTQQKTFVDSSDAPKKIQNVPVQKENPFTGASQGLNNGGPG